MPIKSLEKPMAFGNNISNNIGKPPLTGKKAQPVKMQVFRAKAGIDKPKARPMADAPAETERSQLKQKEVSQ